MKSLLVALLVIAGTAWAGTSYFAGTQSESIYDQALSQINAMQRTSLNLNFEKESFEQGFIQSKAITAVKESNATDSEVLFRLAHDINHSTVQLPDNRPVVANATIRTTLVKGSINPKFDNLQSAFINEEPIEIITRAGLSGHIVSEANMSGVNYTGAIGQTVSIDETTVTVTQDTNRVFVEGKLGNLNITESNGQSSTLSPVTLNAEFASQNAHVSPYSLLATANQLTMLTPGRNTPLTATGLQFSTNAIVNNELINYSVVANADSIDPGNQPTIDTAPITSGTVTLKLNNISVKAINEFNKSTQRFINEGNETFSRELAAEYAKLVTKGTEFMLDIDLNNSAGNANANLSALFVGDQSETGRETIVSGEDLVNAMQIQTNIVADKAALALSPVNDVMQLPSAQMTFFEQGEQYVSKFQLNGFNAKLNGESIPLNEWTGGFLHMPLELMLGLSN